MCGFIPSSWALAEAATQAEGRLGEGRGFAKEEAGILVGNHSNEAMKPEPYPEQMARLAWEGVTRGGRGWRPE